MANNPRRTFILLPMANNSTPVEDRRVQLSDLCDDMIMEIFARLPVNKLFPIQRVSRTWKRCVDAVLTEVKVIVFDNNNVIASPKNIDPSCSHLRLACDNRQTLFVKMFSNPCDNNDWNITNTSIIRSLTRCPSVKCLDFSCIENITNEEFKMLTNVFPELECLSLGSVYLLDGLNDTVEWLRIFGELSSKLVHLKIYSDFYSRNKYLDLSVLLHGDRLREVHLCFGEILKPALLDQIRNRSQVELILDLDWSSLDYDFSCFNRLTFVVNKLTPTCKSFFKEIDAPTTYDFSVTKFSSEQLFLRESLIVFKTFNCFIMDSVKIDKNSFNCRFEILETLNLINTSAKVDADFAKLFGSMQQLKKMVIQIYKWQPNYQHFPGQSLTVLKRLEIIEIEVAIEKPEQIRMTKLFDALMQMFSLNCVQITCNFNRYLFVPQEIKQSLIVAIALLCLSWTKINVELRFNKPEFKVDVNEEVVEWYASTLEFDQINAKYSEDEEVYKVKFTSKNVDY